MIERELFNSFLITERNRQMAKRELLNSFLINLYESRLQLIKNFEAIVNESIAEQDFKDGALLILRHWKQVEESGILSLKDLADK